MIICARWCVTCVKIKAKILALSIVWQYYPTYGNIESNFSTSRFLFIKVSSFSIYLSFVHKNIVL